jgi:hypothetical protein
LARINLNTYTRHQSTLLHIISKKMTSNENIDIETLKLRIDEQANLVRKLKNDPNQNKVCRTNSFYNLFFLIFYSRKKSTLLFKNY